MKTIYFSFASLLCLSLLTGCGSQQQSSFQPASMMLQGDFLFEGPNTLQAANSITMEAIKTQLKLSEAATGVSIASASVSLAGIDEGLVESLTLQVVSENHDMLTLATLNPINGTEATLQIAEETELLPYLSDGGASWVLDVNLSEDHMDMLELPLTLELSVTHP